MIFRILILFMFISAVSVAQNTKAEKPNILATYSLADDTNKVIALLSLSTQYYNISHDTSATLAKKALEIAKDIDYPRGETEALFRVGNNYLYNKHWNKSIIYFSACIEKGKELNFLYWTARSYRKIASIQFSKNKFIEANQLERKAINIHIAQDDSANIAQCYNQFSIFHKKQGEIDSAYYYTNQAIKIELLQKDKRALGRSYRNLAGIYLFEKKIKKAEQYYQKTLEIQAIYANKHNLINSYNQFGELYLQQEKYTLAITYFKKGIAIAEEIKLPRELPLFYKNLSLAEELSGKHKQAIATYLKYIEINDSLQYKKDLVIFLKKQSDLELLKLQNTTLSLQQEKENRFISSKNKKNLTIILIIGIISLVFLIINTLKKQNIIEEIVEKENALKEQLTATNIRNEQFNAINEITQKHEITKEQIAKELHDGLGGTLAAIKMNLMHIKPDNIITKIIDDIGKASSGVRFVSHDLHPPLLQSQTFCIILQDYLNHIFSNTDLELSLTMLPKAKINNLNLEIQLTLYRIIQELCANIKNHAKASKINFQLLAHTNDINLIIEDNGVGFTVSNTTLKTNKGLALIKERLRIIDGEIEIDSQNDNGCTVYIFIPTNKQ